MRSNVLKVSALAATIAASFGAQAAVYEVHKVDSPRTDVLNYGVAVAPSSLECWTTDKCDSENNAGPHTPDTFDIAIESKKNLEGFSYREESPFTLSDGYDYVDDEITGFENYCNFYLDYQSDLCSKWALERWNGYSKEINNSFYENSLAYVAENVSPLFPVNTIVNEVVSGGDSIGNRRDTNNNYRNVGFIGSTNLTAPDSNTFKTSHAWRSVDTAGGKTYIVGSVSRHLSGMNSSYAGDTVSKAAIWDLSAPTAPVEINWDGAQIDRSDRVIPQGSARDITEIGSTLYAVGYNSDSDERLRASVFDSANGTSWNSRFVSPPEDIDYLANYTLQAVNENGIAVGTFKLKEQAQGGSLANSLFYINNVASTLTPIKLSDGIFFAGANGKVGNINKFNELVGQVDYERHSETNGKPRAKRAFATVIGNTSLSKAPYAGQSRYLDDLTLGLAANNAYRIFDATDINDAGIISGTAYYCAGGYDSEAIDATCNGGAAGEEQVVAVKLVPIQGATAADIQSRPQEEVTVERQGASFGWLALGLLGLLGFRRK